MNRFIKSQLWLGKLALGLALGIMPGMAERPVLGAEQVSLSYGMVHQSISIDALATYAATGRVDGTPIAHIPFAQPEHLAQFRHILTTPVPLEPAQTRQFLRTTAGEQLVAKLTALVQEDDSPTQVLAMHVALMRATRAPEGLTLLSVLQQFPEPSVTLHLDRLVTLVHTWQGLGQQTQQAIAQIHEQAQYEASLIAPDPGTSRPLDQPGIYTWEQQTFNFKDASRDRPIPVDLYLPIDRSSRPVIVISHGLGSDRSTLAYLAQHLASFGFVVAVPEHRGSNWLHLQAFLEGTVDQIMDPEEFIDRPLDVSYVLDRLTELSQPGEALQGRLNLEQIGVLGQSLGGYTVLALAGATPHFAALANDCPHWQESLNPSLLLQCQTQTLSLPAQGLADPRVKAAIAISPIGSQIFGPEGMGQIQIPVLMLAGSDDLLAPALAEQIHPFQWLTTTHKYLAVVQGGNHYSSIVASEALPPGPMVAYRYTTALSTAFLATYIARHSWYQRYLNAAYTSAISHEPFSLSLVRSLPASSTPSVPSGFFLTHPLIALGLSVQALGLLYFVRSRRFVPPSD